MNGDTIGIYTTPHGNRYTPLYFISGNDTIANVQNAVQYSNSTWHDTYFDYYSNLKLHFLLLPIIVSKHPGFIHNITHGNLTFNGIYPNPTIANTSIKLSINKHTTIKIQIVDQYGRLYIFDNKTLDAGEHTISLETNSLPKGTYICQLITSDGDGIATQLIIK